MKLSVLELLNRKYGIVEEDFLSAELCAVRWERVWTDSIVSLAVIVEYARGDLALLHLPLRLCQQHRA